MTSKGWGIEIVKIELKIKNMEYQLKQSFLKSLFGATSYSMTSTKITGFNVSGGVAGVSMSSEKLISNVNNNLLNKLTASKNKKTPVIETDSE